MQAFYSWWYGSPLSIVIERYSCSTNMSRIIWCENVIFDMESFSFALSYILGEKPYGPPIMNTSRLLTVFIFFFIHSAISMLRISFPCSSRRTTWSACWSCLHMSSASCVFCCSGLILLVFLSSGIVIISNPM